MPDTDFQIDVQAMYDAALEQAAKESGVKEDAKKATPKAPKPRGRPKVEKPPAPEPRVAPRAVAPAPVPRPPAPKAKSSAVKSHKGEDPAERSRLVRHILKYRALLDGSSDPETDPKSLKTPSASMSIEDLRILKEQYRLARSMGGARARLGELYGSAVGLVEAASAEMDPFHSLRGLSQAVMQREDAINPLLDEIAIEWDEYLTLEPKKALILTTFQIASGVYADNHKRVSGEQKQ